MSVYKTIEITTIDLAIIMDELSFISEKLYHLDLQDVNEVGKAVNQSFEIDKITDTLEGFKTVG